MKTHDELKYGKLYGAMFFLLLYALPMLFSSYLGKGATINLDQVFYNCQSPAHIAP